MSTYPLDVNELAEMLGLGVVAVHKKFRIRAWFTASRVWLW